MVGLKSGTTGMFFFHFIFLMIAMNDNTDNVPDEIRPPQKALGEEAKPGHISFTAEVQPILAARCNPCHFEGGKMYATMPFDDAKTIIAHKAGILNRIKDSPDAEKLKAFLEQNR
jgi:hypothetical protein